MIGTASVTVTVGDAGTGRTGMAIGTAHLGPIRHGVAELPNEINRGCIEERVGKGLAG